MQEGHAGDPRGLRVVRRESSSIGRNRALCLLEGLWLLL